MMPLLAWAWLFTLPGLVLTGLGVPPGQRGAGYTSLRDPLVTLVVAVIGLIGVGSSAVTFGGWLPFLPDGAYRALADPLSALMRAIQGFVASLVYVSSLG